MTALIALQTLVNVGVVCGALPPTGLPLPFVSAGGTSLVASLAATGMLLSVSRGTEKPFLTLKELRGVPAAKVQGGRA